MQIKWIKVFYSREEIEDEKNCFFFFCCFRWTFCSIVLPYFVRQVRIVFESRGTQQTHLANKEHQQNIRVQRWHRQRRKWIKNDWSWRKVFLLFIASSREREREKKTDFFLVLFAVVRASRFVTIAYCSLCELLLVLSRCSTYICSRNTEFTQKFDVFFFFLACFLDIRCCLKCFFSSSFSLVCFVVLCYCWLNSHLINNFLSTRKIK